MNHQDHLPPDWMIEMSLNIFAVAILVMGVIIVLKRLQRGAARCSEDSQSGKTKHRREKSQASKKLKRTRIYALMMNRPTGQCVYGSAPDECPIRL